jgi:predicted phosphoadenosine phosphosulfate sulfurtransferase
VEGAKGKGKPVVHMPPKKIMKGVGQAIKDWSMIEEGDRLLLGLSGGKDSLALLHILLAVQVRATNGVCDGRANDLDFCASHSSIVHLQSNVCWAIYC